MSKTAEYNVAITTISNNAENEQSGKTMYQLLL